MLGLLLQGLGAACARIAVARLLQALRYCVSVPTKALRMRSPAFKRKAS